MCDSTRREILDVGSQRIIREVFFPQSRREFGDATGGMQGDALQDVDQVGVGIDAVQSAGHDEHWMMPTCLAPSSVQQNNHDFLPMGITRSARSI